MQHPLCLALAIAMFGPACSRDRSARATGDWFVDKYYIEIDHAAALEVAEGVVAERVRGEQALVAVAMSQGVGPTQVLPRVFYTVKSETPQGSDTRLVYDVSIDSSGAKLRKEVALVVAKREKVFRVTGWTEADEPGLQ
jgi:hypothetical protein